MNKKTNKKKEKQVYDEDGGLLFMKNWSPTLRWVSILPAIIITYIVVRILFLGPVLNMLEKESYLLSFYISAIVSGVVFFAIIDAASATAPTKRVLVSVVVAIILGVLVIASTVIIFYGLLFNAIDVDSLKPNKMHLIIGSGISLISNVFCLFLGVKTTKDRQKKDLKNPNTNIVQ